MAIKIEQGGVPLKPAAQAQYAAHLTSTPIQASTSITKKTGKTEGPTTSKDETLHKGVLIPEQDLILLTVEGGSTINLGNYESARIGVVLRVPTKKNELDASYDWCVGWITQKIGQAIKDAKGEA